uniref:Dynein heavy chain hydrolytic ATP-binding dynein motor region domain-containing protein n=1 Tax=Timema cristinae TaxID=61476 RepID=A0A7R9CRV4_TIMCR|nr:unnamed protein product [Timema cristinae]
MSSHHSGTRYKSSPSEHYCIIMSSHHSGTRYKSSPLEHYCINMSSHLSGTRRKNLRVDLELGVQVEENMRNTLRSTLGKSLEDLKTKERKDWVLKWPGQLVIAGSQTEWTAHVEQGILEEKLPEYYNTMLEQLDDLRGLVKGPLERVERQVLSALIVIEVHARDVLANLLKENVKNINDFEWISQLRYYWVEEELKVRAVNAEFQYGYEYLGNSGRLVITPLTDRCYLTLTGALHLKFGGAPAGPAGTGKTETTKDLAKAFAIQCVVFNCSDQLDFMAMGKFFKGLARDSNPEHPLVTVQNVSPHLHYWIPLAGAPEKDVHPRRES